MGGSVLTLEGAELTLAGNAGPVEILRGITLEIERGESLGLIGPSGSGKSSLLMLMAGLERPTGGRVTALGADLGAMGEDALARFRRGRMGVVFQSFHLVPTMTALENVALPLEIAGAPRAFARAAEELEAVGLSHRARHYPAELSGGEQQRVALARAAAPRPALFLADEPTGNLDSANGAAVMELLFALRDRHGATLVLVTHAPELAARCDRVVRLADGRVAEDSRRPAGGALDPSPDTGGRLDTPPGAGADGIPGHAVGATPGAGRRAASPAPASEAPSGPAAAPARA